MCIYFELIITILLYVLIKIQIVVHLFHFATMTPTLVIFAPWGVRFKTGAFYGITEHLSLTHLLSECKSRQWMPSAPVPWVCRCSRRHALCPQLHPPLNARPLARRAWSLSGARTVDTHAPCFLTTRSTHYKWRTRTTGGVHTRQTNTHTHICTLQLTII